MRWIWIDKFVEFESGRRAVAVKNVTLAEEHLHDHFPGFPVMPECLMIEAMAQTAGILVGEAKDFQEKVILAKISKATFFDYVRPGDRIRPLGMTGSVKVADLMVNRKIPKLARPRWPLVVAGDRVIWVPGLHISEEARVGGDTRQVLQMEVVPPEGEGDAEAAL